MTDCTCGKKIGLCDSEEHENPRATWIGSDGEFHVNGMGVRGIDWRDTLIHENDESR